MSGAGVDRRGLAALIADLDRVSGQCKAAGLIDAGARLARVGRRLAPFAGTVPVPAQTDPFWTYAAYASDTAGRPRS